MEATDRVIVTEDTNSINSIMEKKKQTLSDCQKQIRKFHPKKHGELLFRIYVSPIGKVSKVKTLKSDLKDHKILNCFEYKMGTWDGFPEEDVKFERQVEFTFKY